MTVTVSVDEWGNWKRIEGRYVHLTGSISIDELEEDAERGSDYAILVGDHGYAETVLAASDGRFFDRHRTHIEIRPDQLRSPAEGED